ncbi:hypothetical protein VKS41_002497 [Umbelopsis sp. WA50703]
MNEGNSFSGLRSRDSGDYFTTLQNERELTYALETILSLSQEERELLALVSVVLTTLDISNPLSMAFLNHIIDRAALPSKSTIANISSLLLRKLRKSKTKEDATIIKQNALVLWSILAERFAGDLCLSLWSDDIGDEVLAILADPYDDCSVRLFALLALEKFALTGTIKNFILARPININELLSSTIRECQQKYQSTTTGMKLPMYAYSTMLEQDYVKAMPLSSFYGLFRKTSVPSYSLRSSPVSSPAESSPLLEAYEVVSRFHRSNWISAANPSMPSFDTNQHKRQCDKSDQQSEDTVLAIWAKYRQLEHCAWWSLSHCFGTTEASKSWDLSELNVTMNPLDATSRWKMGSSGLELRNDHPNFESVRATANVKAGKWYYEVLALTNGIMQIGWATERCHFAPEDGLGVGDDNNGFGFDCCRNTIWANGTAVYPPTCGIPPCKPGDVIGTYLDLDNGLCTFFINGRDYGLTVEFDQPRKQVYETNLARREKYFKDGHQVRDVDVLGLYPAISLTSHQHVIINFGNQAWMYPPPLSHGDFKAMKDCEAMSSDLRRNIVKLTSLRGRKLTRVPLSSLARKAAELSGREVWLDSDSDSDTVSSEDREQVFCTICYAEPHCIQLQPCGHGGLCRTCAKIIDTCPLCRCAITRRKFVELDESSSSTLSLSNSSDGGQPLMATFSLPKATMSSLHLTLNTIEEMHERFL